MELLRQESGNPEGHNRQKRDVGFPAGRGPQARARGRLLSGTGRVTKIIGAHRRTRAPSTLPRLRDEPENPIMQPNSFKLGQSGTSMAGKRRYEDGCAFAQSLDLVGERWALLVVRELIFGPKRFTDLKSDLPGIATNVLSQRMADLEEAAIVVKRELPPPGRATVYELTDWGRDLAPIFKVMGRWAARSPHLKHDWPMSVNAALLSLGAMFRPGRAKGFEAVIEMHLSDRPFTVSVLGKQLAVEPGVPRAPDVTLRCDQNLLLSVLYRGHPLDAAEAEGMQVTGDRSVLEQFAGFFPMPKPAPGRAA